MLDGLRWKKFPVLDDGFVTLVDVMGDDAAIVQAARVSYGKDTRADDVDLVEKENRHIKIAQSDRQLLRYLMRHRHTTPFEMAEIKLLVRVPMDCWRQWIRHRTANVNEYSTRYTEAIDSQQKTDPSEWRLQATNNKQGSSGKLLEWPSGESCKDYYTSGVFGEVQNTPSPGMYLSEMEEDFQKAAKVLYEERLKFGVAKEQARKDLPLSTYTEAYWKIDLHNMLHFLALRMDSHAQLEIRQYATTIGEQIVKPLFPMVWEAFEDYRLGAAYLSRLDLEVIRNIVGNMDEDWPQVPWGEKYSELEPNSLVWPVEWRGLSSCRERDECVEKLKRLGIVSRVRGVDFDFWA